jgi:hypothetical protein
MKTSGSANSTVSLFSLHGNAQFGLTTQDRGMHFVRRTIQQPDAVVGVLGRVAANYLGQHMRGHGGDAGQGEVALGALRHVLQALDRSRHVMHDIAGLGQEFPPDRRQLDTARRAVEQLQVQIGFQLLDAPRQRGLRDVQLLCGLAEAAQLGDHHEGLHAIKVDFHGVSGRSTDMGNQWAAA